MAEEPKQKNRKPDDETIADVLLKSAQAGDLGRVPNVLSGRGSLAYGPSDQHSIIRKCIAACSAGDTSQLVDALYRNMLEFDAALLLRAQTQALYLMKRGDERTGPAVRQLTNEAVEEIERVGRIEERIVYLVQSIGKQKRGPARRSGNGGGGGKPVLKMTDYHPGAKDAPATGGE